VAGHWDQLELRAFAVTGNGERYPLEITTEIRRERIVAIRKAQP
jgi:hypothetical protein